MREVQVLQKTKIVPNGSNRGSTGALNHRNCIMNKR